MTSSTRRLTSSSTAAWAGGAKPRHNSGEEEAYTVREDGLYGFYRTDGSVLLEPNYAAVGPFSGEAPAARFVLGPRPGFRCGNASAVVAAHEIHPGIGQSGGQLQAISERGRILFTADAGRGLAFSGGVTVLQEEGDGAWGVCGGDDLPRGAGPVRGKLASAGACDDVMVRGPGDRRGIPGVRRNIRRPVGL